MDVDPAAALGAIAGEIPALEAGAEAFEFCAPRVRVVVADIFSVVVAAGLSSLAFSEWVADDDFEADDSKGMGA